MKIFAIIILLIFTFLTVQQVSQTNQKSTAWPVGRPGGATNAGVPSDAILQDKTNCKGYHCGGCQICDCFYTECMKSNIQFSVNGYWWDGVNSPQVTLPPHHGLWTGWFDKNKLTCGANNFCFYVYGRYPCNWLRFKVNVKRVTCVNCPVENVKL